MKKIKGEEWAAEERRGRGGSRERGGSVIIVVTLYYVLQASSMYQGMGTRERGMDQKYKGSGTKDRELKLALLGAIYSLRTSSIILEGKVQQEKKR